MQDKKNIKNVVQEISELIDVYAGILAEMEIEDRYDTDMHHKCSDAWFNIESKLRELVREPLSDGVIKMIDDSTHFHESVDWSIRFARAIERAHGITKDS